MWLILWLFGAVVAEALEGVGDVLQHRKVRLSFFVVPIEGKSEVSFSVPVCCVLVVFFDNTNKVISVFFSDVFHAEIVDDQGETDWSPLVSPKPGCV